MEKIKILFWGDAVTETGFARVLHSIAKYLPERYDISWIGVNHSGDPHKYPYRIYPAILGGDLYGINRLDSILNIEKPQIIFILNDAWVQAPMLDAIKKHYSESNLPAVYTYTPVDAEDHDPDWYKSFDIVKKAVAYTKFGRDEIAKVAPQLEQRLFILPHGVDSKIFYKFEGDKEQIKKSFYPNRPDFYEDSFIILNASRNQPRKRIDITMRAFQMFSEDKPENVKLYLHMGVIDSHINLQKLSMRYGIDSRLIISNFSQGVQVVPVERLNQIYNATDVGLNTSLGEGWSLTNIEHAVTGAPQVVAGHSALRELYSDCGIVVPTVMDYVLDNIMTTGKLVRPEDVARGFELLYQNRDLMSKLSELGIAKFTKPEYSWEVIAKRWVEEIFEV